MTVDYKWWKDASIYQIWPASFKDSNGDGFGDLKGIISKLDYISNLGVDVVWLSPMYDSPQDDMGYDISDYQKIYPKYGNMEDMDELIEKVHKKGLKLVLDLVINHTSSEHDWFKESRSSKENPKRDWYVWKPPRYDKDGNRHPPNNWISYFSESAWTYDETTGEYYLHLFAERQPDLNWENPHTRDTIYDVALKYWFDKGIDGFRIDTAGMYSKVQTFPDAPIVFPDSEWQPCQLYHQNGPRIHEFHKEMFSRVTSKYDAMTVGEVGHSSVDETLKYVSAKEKELNMVFLFDTVDLGSSEGDKFANVPFDLKDFKKSIEKEVYFAEQTDGWSSAFIENHDQPRSISRFGSNVPKYQEKSGKLLALLMSSLSGTLYIYQGQELGMTNLPRSWSIDEYLDINTINYYREFIKNHGNDKQKLEKLMDAINLLARDHARSPIQWDASENGGFTTGKPWTRVNDNYKTLNAASQVNDSNSLYSFWRESLKLRKENKDLFVYGKSTILDYDNLKTFTFIKESGHRKAYFVFNFSTDEVPFENLTSGELELLGTNVDKIRDKLTPYEGRIYLVK